MTNNKVPTKYRIISALMCSSGIYITLAAGSVLILGGAPLNVGMTLVCCVVMFIFGLWLPGHFMRYFGGPQSFVDAKATQSNKDEENKQEDEAARFNRTMALLVIAALGLWQLYLALSA